MKYESEEFKVVMPGVSALPSRPNISNVRRSAKKVELLDERDQARERAEESAREQADMDSIGLMRARLGGAIA